MNDYAIPLFILLLLAIGLLCIREIHLIVRNLIEELHKRDKADKKFFQERNK